MTVERLFEAIGAADGEMIRRAETPVKKRKKTWRTLAACLVCAVGIGLAGSFFFGGKFFGSDSFLLSLFFGSNSFLLSLFFQS